jgi:hypothetical protein
MWFSYYLSFIFVQIIRLRCSRSEHDAGLPWAVFLTGHTA